MKLTLTSHEAQIIVDELRNAVAARKNTQPEYAKQCQDLADRILTTSRGTAPQIRKMEKALKLISAPLYETIVGNIGTVYSGLDKAKAYAAYREYVKQSKDNYGRAAGESVTIMENGEIHRDYTGTLNKE